MARLYRAARDGAVAATDAAKLTFVLMSIAALIRDQDFEARLLTLEQRTTNADAESA